MEKYPILKDNERDGEVGMEQWGNGIWYSSHHFIRLQAFLEVVHILLLPKCELPPQSWFYHSNKATQTWQSACSLLSPIHADVDTVHPTQGIWIWSRWKWESPGPTWMLQRSWWDTHFLTGVTCSMIINLSFYLTLTCTHQTGIIPKQLTFHLKRIFDHLSSAEENQRELWWT